jgi:hypothetical protein
MPRVTVPEVRAILPAITELSDHQIRAAIIGASCTVDTVATGCGSHLSADCLKQVELYLSAHFAASTENALSLQSEKDGCSGGSVVYGFKFGEGVKGTPFGQTANTISGGCLVTMDASPARFFSIGAC